MRTELEVKYDILRGENYRLSRKLDHYESGKAFEAFQRKHDKELKSLKNDPSAQLMGHSI